MWVLMHDTARTDATVEALPQVIDWFRGSGYHFCTVEQMYQARDGRLTGAAIRPDFRHPAQCGNRFFWQTAKVKPWCQNSRAFSLHWVPGQGIIKTVLRCRGCSAVLGLTAP